jgi:hypothetical protein
MKLTVGVKSASEARYFLENGAHELYCGLAGLLNNRLPRENLSAPEGAGEIIDLARGRGARVFLAVNEIVPEKLYAPALNILASLKERGLFGIILRDPAFLAWLRSKKFRSYVTLSTLALCFNKRALEFFARLGIDRLVLPMQMTPENAGYALKNRLGIETEVFCQRLYYGVNVDSLCFLPCPQTAEEGSRKFPDFTCLLPFKSPGGEYRMPMPGPDYMLNAFYDFYKGGAGYVKVARWPNTDRQIDLFQKVRYLVKLLEKGAGRKLFVHEGLKIDSKPLQYGKSFTYRPLRA